MNMNCLEYHRRITFDPCDRDPALLRHGIDCPPCGQFGQRVARAEQTLRNVIDVDMPSGLSARILLRQSCAEQRAARTRRRRWLALAASVVLTVTIAGAYLIQGPDNTLQQSVLAHVSDEPFALESHETIDLSQVNDIAQPMQTRIDNSVGTVRFASICRIRETDGVHLVVAGEKGPVTVMILPKEPVSGRVTLADDRFEGIIVPRAAGSIAIVGQHGEALDAVEARVRLAVHQL